MASWKKPVESLVFIMLGILTTTTVFKRGLPDWWDVASAAVMATWVEMWLMWQEGQKDDRRKPPAQ